MIGYKRTLQAIQEPDRKVLELKYAAKRIGEMNGVEQERWTIALLLKINVITGWVVDEKLETILADQFKKKLIESYPDMNVEEIEYAFRQHGTTIQDWGKAMNLSLIDQVLIPYRNQRFYLSAAEEERKVPPPPQKIYSQEEIDNENRMLVEAFYQRIRSGGVENIPMYAKDILVKDGFIKEYDSVSDFFVNALNSGRANIYVKDDY